jgi:hypothetical protein
MRVGFILERVRENKSGWGGLQSTNWISWFDVRRIQIQSRFDERDSLKRGRVYKREKVNKREVFCAS